MVFHFFVRSEQVHCQGFGFVPHFFGQGFDVAVREEWEDGPENLVVHHGALMTGLLDHSWRHVKFVFYDFATIQHFSFMLLVQVRLQALQVVFVDDFGIVTATDEVLLIKGSLHFLQKDLLELVVDLLVDIDMVSANAGLSAVNPLPKDDALGGTLQVCSVVDYHWALPTQFQQAWREVLGGLDGDQPSSLGGAGKADDVHFELGESPSDLNPSLNHPVKT